MLSDFKESCNMCIFVHLFAIISAKTCNVIPSGFSVTLNVNECVLTLCDSLLMCHVSGICFWNILLFDPAYLPTGNM